MNTEVHIVAAGKGDFWEKVIQDLNEENIACTNLKHFKKSMENVRERYEKIKKERFAEENTSTEEEFNNDISFGDILNSIERLLDHKNKNYGNAALEPLEIFAGKTKVGQRLDDKLSRVKNAEELRKNDIADLLGYLVLVCKEKGWDNFDEFMD